MQTQVNKPPRLPMGMAGMAIILFCAAGIAAIVGWIPTSIGATGNNPGLATAAAKPAGAKTHTAPVQVLVLMLVASNAPARAKCTECGVVESTREIDTRAEGSGPGAVGGAVLGGGRGKDVATVAGAVGAEPLQATRSKGR